MTLPPLCPLRAQGGFCCILPVLQESAAGGYRRSPARLLPPLQRVGFLDTLTGPGARGGGGGAGVFL